MLDNENAMQLLMNRCSGYDTKAVYRLKWTEQKEIQSNESYPFGKNEVPVKVIYDGKYFLTCIVLPHQSNHVMSSESTNTYPITLSKYDIASNRFTLTLER